MADNANMFEQLLQDEITEQKQQQQVTLINTTESKTLLGKQTSLLVQKIELLFLNICMLHLMINYDGSIN